MDEPTESVREWMRGIAKLPRRHKTKACLICGTTFATQGRGRYCSAACRSKAYRRRLVLSPEPAETVETIEEPAQ
jgi:hypothetical protein